MIKQIITLAAASMLAISTFAQDWAVKGAAAEKANDYVRAAICFEKAVAQNPTNLDNLLSLTGSYGNLNLFDKAADSATRLLDAARSQKNKDMEMMALQHLAFTSYGSFRLDQADDYIARARKLDPDEDYIDYIEILVAKRRGQTDQALEMAQKALDKHTPADSYYFEILTTMADLQVQKGKAGEALKFIRRGISSNPYSADVKSFHRALAHTLTKSGNYSQAITESAQWSLNDNINTLCDSASNNLLLQMRAMERNSAATSYPWWAAHTYGQVLSNLARLPEAAEKFHTARLTGNLSWTPLPSIAQEAYCYNRMHNPARAAALADMALACDSDILNAEDEKMTAAIEMGDRNTAIDILNKWKNRKGWTHLLSEHLMMIGDVELARQWLPVIEERIAYEQAMVRPMTAYAVLLEMLGQHDKAVATAQKVIYMVNKYGFEEDGVSVNYIDCCALAAPSNPIANKAVEALINSPTAAIGYLRASACLRASQGRTDEALSILDAALRRGTPVSIAKNTPLLSPVRSLPKFADVLRPYEQMIAKSTAPEWKTTASIAYKGSESKMTIKVEVDGVSMDVNVNYNGIDAQEPSIGATDYDFLLKNNHATRADGTRGTIKGLKIGDTLIGDISVSIVPGSQKLTLTRCTLVRLGRMQIDSAAKTLNFDNTL